MTEAKLRFNVKLEGAEGTSGAWMPAPFDVPETFGTKGRVPVKGTINRFPFRSSLMPMGGCHGMPVNKKLREGAQAEAGDVVEVVMERDLEERTIEAPPELKKELAKYSKAREHWDKLAFTHKKEMANWIREAKQDETKKRRLTKVMDVLKKGTKWTG